MKKNLKTWIAGGSALTLLVGVLTIPTLAATGSQTARLDYANMKVTLNGHTLDLRDASGNSVEPFTINGTTYLPVASIGKALGLNVGWDNSTKTVILTSGQGTQTTPSTGNTAGTGAYIGEAKAKEIALDHAGLSASQVNFVRSTLEYDDGRAVYDVDFWSGNKEYDYEIDAKAGTILSYDFDIEGYTPGGSTAQSGTDIGAERAKTIALNHAGISASNAVFLHAKLDYDDGRRIYEVEFYSGSKEYDYEIDAATGQILSFDYDAEHYTPSAASGNYIGEAKAKQIVEQRAGTTGTYREFKLERDDGRMVYEGELRSGWTEYEFTIDALTGTILEWEVDH